MPSMQGFFNPVFEEVLKQKRYKKASYPKIGINKI